MTKSKSKFSKIQLAEAKRQRKFVSETLYGWLLCNTTSIWDAKSFCEFADKLIQQMFSKKVGEAQMKLSKAKISEFGFKADPLLKDKQYSKFKELMELFDDEPVAVATNLIGGMATAIASFEKEESSKRKLETLKTSFLS